MAGAGKHSNLMIFSLLLLLFIFFVGSPFYWALVTSFKTTSQISQMNSLFWPKPFTMSNYWEIIFNTNFVKWYVNSIIVSALSTLISVSIGATAAYALIRLNFPGRRLLSSSVLMTYLIPPTILFIPFYLMFSKSHITDSIWSLVLSYPTFNIPFCTWILMGFFANIPKSIEEAARIDGANSLQVFGLICIPLMKPGIIAAIVFSFNLSWMEFLYALSFITTDYKKTVPVGLSELMVGDVIFWGPLMAGAVLTAFPVILLFIFLQKHFVTGLTAGSVKG